jgi:RNA polymerase sigma factor (sigma-70 family)
MMIDPSDAEVYEKHSDELVRFATMLVGPSNAEDVVADAVLRVFASPSWQSVANRRAYLFRSVLAQASSTARSTRRRLTRERRFLVTDTTDEPMLRPELLAALRSLTVRQRAVVFMTYWLDQTTEATCQVLQISERTVQRELESAYRRMERHLHD